jgi:hypothetical protein
MAVPVSYRGACHCGAASFVFTTPLAFHEHRPETADLLICARCGACLGATPATPARSFGIIDVRTLDAPGITLIAAAPMDYGDEDAVARRARRACRWTPVVGA